MSCPCTISPTRPPARRPVRCGAAGLLFDPQAVPAGWVRVGGVLFALIGWQYLGTASGDPQGLGPLGFYLSTVWSRMALVCAFCALVMTGQAPPGLLVLAALNLAGAASMALALRGLPARGAQAQSGVA